MSEKKNIPLSTIALGVFSALEEKGWHSLTLRDVAGAAAISLEDLHGFATSKEDLVGVVISYIEGKSLLYREESEESYSDDHLFDLLFSYFEAAQPHKIALTHLWRNFKESPLLIRPFMPYFLKALRAVGVKGKLDFDGPFSALQLRGFGLIYLNIVRTWLEDSSPDLSKTMAETNKAVTKYIPCLFDPCKIIQAVLV